MRRQSRWDRRHLATLSTHVTKSQAEDFRAACRANAVRPYVAIRDFVLQYTRENCPKSGTMAAELDQTSDAAASIIRDFVLRYARENCPKGGTMTDEAVTRLQVDLDQISDAAAAIIDQATETRAAITSGVMV